MVRSGQHPPSWRSRLFRVASITLMGAGVLLVGSAWPQALADRVVPPLTAPIEFPVWASRPTSPPAPKRAPRHLFRIPVTVTGYSSCIGETDDSPLVTASNTTVRRGIIALSRDLLREFTPGAPFGFGDLVELEGAGVFRVEDTMAQRHRRRVDIWFSSKAAATRWGKQYLVLARLNQESEQEERRLREQSGSFGEAAFTD